MSIHKKSSSANPLTTDHNGTNARWPALRTMREIQGVTYRRRSDDAGDAGPIIRLNSGTYTSKITFKNVSYTGFRLPHSNRQKENIQIQKQKEKVYNNLKGQQGKGNQKRKGKAYRQKDNKQKIQKERKNIVKTNQKGKATFKANRNKKGEYKEKVTFKGNKYYTMSPKKSKSSM